MNAVRDQVVQPAPILIIACGALAHEIIALQALNG